MHYKVERNFKCADVVKEKGEFLSSAEEEKIKSFIPKLAEQGVLLKLEVHPEVKEKILKFETKPKKKKKTFESDKSE